VSIVEWLVQWFPKWAVRNSRGVGVKQKWAVGWR